VNTPYPHQIEGARFLAARKSALLADEQRVGKTGAAIMACDYVLARRILVVTTASGRPNWKREFGEWSNMDRSVGVIYGSSGSALNTDVVIVGWDSLAALAPQLAAQAWDVVIFDESHYAKNPEAKRTVAAFHSGLKARNVWCLSGTPMANSPADLYPMLGALAPERVTGLTYDAFVDRYCTWYPKRLRFNTIRVITGGKNLDELRQRLDGFWLRRTQQDVGITKPVFALHSLHVHGLPKELRDNEDAQSILDAAEVGETKNLEMHLGPLRRITGQLKSGAAAKAVAEELDNGLDKIVLMAWHTDVIDALKTLLKPYGVVGIDGRTPATARQAAVDEFQRGAARVFVGQIQAAGEGIDLSAACELMFVEYSFVPKDLAQAALRITNHLQKRQPRVRVCALEGSIDESFARILTRKVSTIKQVLERSQT
jgi:SNF2 family DNA or RNA helicase